MSKEAMEHYHSLIASGELNQFFPRATGNWDEDKSQFLRLYEENIKFIKDFEEGKLNLDDDIDEYDEFDSELY